MPHRYPKNAVYSRAQELSAYVTWTQTGSVFRIAVAAPLGKHWPGGVHELVIEARPTTALQRDELWIDMLGRMVDLEECDLNEQGCADWSLPE